MRKTTIINREPLVTILMGVRNGAHHLQDQLDSIAAQTYPNWRLVCSDDGSTDCSREIVQKFARDRSGQVTLVDGPCSGFSDNFMSLLRTTKGTQGYISFADQDDIWLPDKLRHGVQTLDSAGTKPTLYCGRQTYWYPQYLRQKASTSMHKPFTLRNALIENVATGNTIILNQAAAIIAYKAALHTGPVFAHDWWLYLLLTATGGHVHFDNGPPKILYRQHGNNLIGAGNGLLPQIKRKVGVLQGLFSQRVEGNLTALLSVKEILTPEARDICQRFSQARQAPRLTRLSALHRIGLYRQRRAHSVGFWGAASLGCV